jgi:amino acid adenylation domain-containing protein
MEAPTPEATRALSAAAKRALLARRLEGRRRTYPTSFSQQRLWFLEQLSPGSIAYNIPTAMRVTGSLDLEAWTRSCNEIVRRHEALRTTFTAVEGKALQVVAPSLGVEVPVSDLRGLGGAARERALAALSRAEFQTPFDLERGPLLRVRLVRLAEEEHVLLLTVHHIVADFWSMAIVLREMVVLYQAFAAGQPSTLPALPIQYADYAVWQRTRFDGPALAPLLEYWRERLAGAPPALELPTDRRRPRIQGLRGARADFTLPPVLIAGLRALAQREGVTPFMVSLAAFQVLLARYTGQDDIVVGVPSANRERAELEDLVGFFVNVLPMRTVLHGNPTFRDVLTQVRAVCVGAYAHAELPFERLVEELQPRRLLDRPPVFQVMFAYQNVRLPPLELGGLRLEPLPADSGTARFDLELQVFELGDELVGWAEYDTSLFDAATIERLLGHWRTLLGAVVQDAGQPIRDLPLMTPGEEAQLAAWNATAAAYPDASIHELVSAQVARTPGAPALVVDGTTVTYRGLHTRALALAGRLRGLGVGPDVLVGVHLERSLAMVVAVLGILEAGGAYLPLDPEYPRARLALMLEDARVRVLLTETSRLADLPDVAGARVVCLDAEPSAGTPPEVAGARPASADDLAYVIYTSGSTGRPKGVEVPHRGVVNCLTALRSVAGMTDRDVLVAVTTLSFDVSVVDLFLPLVVGARIVLVGRDVAVDGARLAAVLAGTEATLMQATPSTWRLLLDAGWRARPGFRVLCGGEPLPRELADRLLAAGARLWNLYGPTETTIYASALEVGPGSGPVPLGPPLANTCFHLLDAHGQRVPPGVPGELVIGGVGVARGYLGRPDLTAERFVPDPFDGGGAGRMYRSGDLVRQRPDGTLEFLGRLDHQVKVRGFRIELGEIETVLADHAGVREAAVTVRDVGPGDRRLVAYVVPDLDAARAASDAAWDTGRVAEWESVWSERYGGRTPVADPTFDVTGWDSSYTGAAIPPAEMREWVDATVARIQALRPARVLEVGCGSGLLLFRIAPESVEYVATDFSAAALDRLRGHLAAARCSLPQVRLVHAPAEALDEVGTHAFDVVVVNSVVQYLPSPAYLLRVIEGAVRAVRPGGVVFLGDLRSLPLLETFHASVELHRAPAGVAVEQLWARARRRIAQERELVVDPALFTGLPGCLPDVGYVEVLPRRGTARNELTAFRYDVLVHVRPTPTAIPDGPWLDWQAEGLDPTGLARRLAAAPSCLRLARVPNARLTAHVAAGAALRAAVAGGTVGELRDAVSRLPAAGGVDPEALWELAEERGYAVDVSWARHGPDGAFDVVFRRRDGGACEGVVRFPADDRTVTATTNDTRLGEFRRGLVPRLRTWLRDRLPAHMMPAAFVVLDDLPLSPAGKIDRAALPPPDGTRPDVGGTEISPRTGAEAAVAAIVAEVLGVERVGVHDDFFAAGGHSLAATQVVSRVRSAFGVDLPLATIFHQATVAGLAAAVAAAGPAVASARAVRRAGAVAPLSFAQEWLLAHHPLPPGHPYHNVPAAVRLAGALDVAALESALDEVVGRHAILRTTYARQHGEWVQIVGAAARPALAIVDLERQPDAEQEEAIVRLVSAERARRFDLERGPLLQATLLRRSREDHVLFLTMHHVVTDDWSYGVLVREMIALYAAFRRGLPSPLPPLPVQYADLAVSQRDRLQGRVGDDLRAYWQRQLDGAPAGLRLPGGRAGGRRARGQARGHAFTIAPEVVERLDAFVRREGVTRFMGLLAAFDVLLHAFTGARDLVVAAPVAGRTHAASESLVGFFVNHLLLRTDLTGATDFRTVVERTQRVCAQAYTHQEWPLQEVVPRRDDGRLPFRVMLNLLDTPIPRFDVEGLTLSPLPSDHGYAVPFVFPDLETALLDLGLIVAPAADGLRATFTYDVDAVSPAVVARMASGFQRLLGAALESTGVRTLAALAVEEGAGADA